MRASLIIAYKRTDCFKAMVESLYLGGIEHIYVAIDGPRPGVIQNNSIKEILVQACKAKNIELTFWERPENLGLAASVISAVDWFFNFETSGLILEDDLVFEKDFVIYCESALKKVDVKSKVLMVSGNQFSEKNIALHSASLTNYPMVWGWATTKFGWELMREMILAEKISWIKSDGSPQARNYWNAGKLRAQKGFLDSWAVPLAASMRATGYACVLPPVNLVSNVGTDSNATHTLKTSENMHATISPLAEKITFDFSPHRRKQNNLYLEKYHFKITKKNIISHFKAVIAIKFLKPKIDPLNVRLARVKLPS